MHVLAALVVLELGLVYVENTKLGPVPTSCPGGLLLVLDSAHTQNSIDSVANFRDHPTILLLDFRSNQSCKIHSWLLGNGCLTTGIRGPSHLDRAGDGAVGLGLHVCSSGCLALSIVLVLCAFVVVACLYHDLWRLCPGRHLLPVHLG